MNARISPDIVLLTCGIFMWLIAGCLPQCSFILPYNILLSCFTLLTGLFLSWSGMYTLLRRRTTTRTDKDSVSKPAALATAGIYKYTRNPVYLGMAFLLFAWMIFLENWASATGIIIFTGFITRFQIKPEEKALGEAFGEEYAQYKKRVRRWL